MEQRPGLRPSVLIRGLLLSSVCWCLLGLAFVAVECLADPGPEFTVPVDKATEPVTPAPSECPAVPVFGGPYEGEEEAAGELQLLRIESAESCKALTDRLDEVVEREWWVVSQLLGQQALAQEDREYSERTELAESEGNELLRELNNQFIPGPLKTELAGVDEEHPLFVTSSEEGSAIEGTAELVSSIDASGEAQKLALWFIVGVLVASGLGYGIYRTIERST